MIDSVQDFKDCAEKVAKTMDFVNKIIGSNKAVEVEVDGVPMVLTLTPLVTEGAEEVEPVVEAEEEQVPVVEAPAI